MITDMFSKKVGEFDEIKEQLIHKEKEFKLSNA
jgi:hypothetical protein